MTQKRLFLGEQQAEQAGGREGGLTVLLGAGELPAPKFRLRRKAAAADSAMALQPRAASQCRAAGPQALGSSQRHREAARRGMQ